MMMKEEDASRLEGIDSAALLSNTLTVLDQLDPLVDTASW
jgi:hypothetical protein